MKCPCGYKHYYDMDSKKWITEDSYKRIIEGSNYHMKPKKISQDLKLIACPECGAVYYDEMYY